MEVMECAKRRADEREERMIRMEMEIEEKRREREERREMQMLSVFSSLLQRMNETGAFISSHFNSTSQLCFPNPPLFSSPSSAETRGHFYPPPTSNNM